MVRRVVVPVLVAAAATLAGIAPAAAGGPAGGALCPFGQQVQSGTGSPTATQALC